MMGSHLLTTDSVMPAIQAAQVQQGADFGWAGLILWMPLISLVLCGLCAAYKVKSKLPGLITVVCLATSFVLTAILWQGYEAPMTIHLFDWIQVHWTGGSFIANFALYVDSLALLWMLFVTGIGTLIALYATEYMEDDVGKGYARFLS